MDAIDILGSILGGGKPGGSGGGGMGGKILRDILGGGGGGGRAPKPDTAPPRPTNIDQQAKELEDLLNVAKGRQGGGTASAGRPAPSRQIDWDGARSSRTSAPPPVRPRRESIGLEDDVDQQNEEALVLIRAMINAAKSDGQVTRDEQQAIMGRLKGAPREAVAFLQREFDRSLDVREFAWSVPVGMEQKVYGISLGVIDLDANSEARYLHDLAHGLRIPPSTRDDIHRRLGAPVIKS